MSELEKKVSEALRIIALVRREFKRPALLWSSGKDSMVLLHLLGETKLPVIFHRHPWFPEKYEFADEVIRNNRLEVYDYPPMSVVPCVVEDDVEIVNCYQIGPGKHLTLPITPYEPDLSTNRFVCGLRDMLPRPTGTFNFPWDAVLHGHKSCDRDTLFGDIPLQSDLVMNQGAPAAAFPLRSWSDEDVWSYIYAHNVPYQETRYHDGKEREDKTQNPDYVEACTRCINPAKEKSVWCPRLGIEVSNVSNQLTYARTEKPQYLKGA